MCKIQAKHSETDGHAHTLPYKGFWPQQRILAEVLGAGSIQHLQPNACNKTTERQFIPPQSHGELPSPHQHVQQAVNFTSWWLRCGLEDTHSAPEVLELAEDSSEQTSSAEAASEPAWAQ